MEQAEMTIFVILTNLVLLIFVTGTILFIFGFRQKRMKYETEKASIRKQHRIELLNTQLAIQQQTMQQIGSEIHDSVGQKLTLAALYARQLLQGDQIPGITDKINSVGNIISESLEELRQLSKTLNNPALVQSDLVTLLKNECERVNATGTCRMYLEHNGSTDGIPAATKYVLFRILQEFIQNSLKHANCKRIVIHLAIQQQLFIHATDDGHGFDLEEGSKGIGLSNMRRRAHQIGAYFDLQSIPGKGTTLTLKLPVENMQSPPI